MDKREYIRLAVSESEATAGGVTPSNSTTDGVEQEVHPASPPTTIEDLPPLPYLPVAASEDAVINRQAGSVGRSMISPHSLKQRRKSQRERWRKT